ncbi:MAG TPA: 30S ribosomal protein S2 [Candidatus Aenigmarchaeota archaeon]|nr:MAG: 30S ribosomal protein S2 [Candidatus Aenigmarchaeota archaeon]HDD46394.1 30S ribosomal protein S2 [Candidatus Aenigmarchaeota archaeon]
MLVEKEAYLTAGIHIGMKSCTKYMKNFVYKVRSDGLAVFNIQKVDERISIAANFLHRFKKIMVVSRKENGIKAVTKFAEIIGGKAVTGRFLPGTLTNPSFKDFYEPDVIMVVDPLIDKQAVEEARKKKLPIVALCDTFNDCVDIDLVIPANNNGKKSLALIFWLLAREILKKRGEIKNDNEFKYTLKDFGGE